MIENHCVYHDWLVTFELNRNGGTIKDVYKACTKEQILSSVEGLKIQGYRPKIYRLVEVPSDE